MSLIEERFEIAKRYYKSVDVDINNVRLTRNQLLAMSDWTQVVDSPLSPEKRAEWAAYRQALRDITDSVDVNNVVWPAQPS